MSGVRFLKLTEVCNIENDQRLCFLQPLTKTWRTSYDNIFFNVTKTCTSYYIVCFNVIYTLAKLKFCISCRRNNKRWSYEIN